MKNKKIFIAFGVTAMTLWVITTSAFAATKANNLKGHNNINRPAIFANKGNITPRVNGTVTAINGSIITITSKKFIKPVTGSTATTPTSTDVIYTVDTSSATFNKFTAPTTTGVKPTTSTITISDVKVGDTLMVQGTVTGTNVVAKTITDGTFGKRGFDKGILENKENITPRVNGTVTAINGSTIIITKNSNIKHNKKNSTITTTPIVYTVDASKAVLNKITPESANEAVKPAPIVITITDIKVGDNLMIEGTVTGTNVAATKITDGQFGKNKNDKNEVKNVNNK